MAPHQRHRQIDTDRCGLRLTISRRSGAWFGGVADFVTASPPAEAVDDSPSCQFKGHLPHSGSVLAELGDTLGGYETSKGSLRFAIDKPLPERLVRQLVRTRMRELGLA
jgi:hypothetical protein